jgi:NAD(P)-dependent dehydrogenase (short-subunit alcohol dehydrogenase family)
MELQGFVHIWGNANSDRVALVTGAASGIGQAIALGFIRDGCRKIVLVDMNESGLQETKQEALKIAKDTQVLIEKCDISDEASVEKVMKSAISEFERLDYAVNCAGFPGAFNITENYTTSDFDRVQQVNVRGTWLCMRAQIRQMKSQTPLESKKFHLPVPAANS